MIFTETSLRNNRIIPFEDVPEEGFVPCSTRQNILTGILALLAMLLTGITLAVV